MDVGLRKYESGIEPDSIPVLSFEFFGLDELYHELSRPDQYAGFVFTSQRAVEAVDSCLKQNAEEKFQHDLVQMWSELPAYVVGTATSSAASKFGFTCRGHDTGTAEVLAKLVCQEIKPKSKPLLFPCGTLKRETLPMALADNNISLKCLEVYKTVPHPNLEAALQDYKEKQGTPDLCVLFSPSGVKFSKMALAGIFPSTQETIQWVAIGPTTRDALEKDGFKVSATAAKPSPEALLASILELKQSAQ